jgi:hypothetical protein
MYFLSNGFRKGNYGLYLTKVPEKPPIIFSRSANDSMSGLGVDHNWVHGST